MQAKTLTPDIDLTKSTGLPTVKIQFYEQAHYFGGAEDDFSSEDRDWELFLGIPTKKLRKLIKGLPSQLRTAFLKAFDNQVVIATMHHFIALRAVSYDDRAGVEHVAEMKPVYARATREGDVELFQGRALIFAPELTSS